MAERLVLWGNDRLTSPYVFSVFVALREKKLDFELQLLSLEKKETLAHEYRDRSLTARVPALQHGDFWLSESSAIEEYLEEVFPPPAHVALYPRSFRDRARARQIQAWLRSDLLALREERPTTCVFLGEKKPPLSAAGRAAAEALVRVASLVLRPGATSLFDSFCIADADLALMLQRLVAHGDEVPAALRAYAEAVWRRPSVREHVEHPRPR